MVSITPQFETVTWIGDLDAVTVSAQVSRYSDLQVSLEWSIAAEQIFKHLSFNTQKFIRWNSLRGSRTGKEINKVLNYILLIWMRIAEETWLEFILLDIWIGPYLMHIFGFLEE